MRELLALTGNRRLNMCAVEKKAAIRAACEHDHLDVVRHLLGLTGDRTVDVHTWGEVAFRTACSGGHLDVVRELLGLTGACTVNVHALQENAFQLACQNGHLDHASYWP